jgi:hypothetical protein
MSCDDVVNARVEEDLVVADAIEPMDLGAHELPCAFGW